MISFVNSLCGQGIVPRLIKILKVFGSECFDELWRDVSGYLRQCNWSGWLEGGCYRGQRKHYRLCMVAGSCGNVIMESYHSLCSSQEIIPLCSDSRELCD